MAIYLDYNASTPIDPQVLAYMIEVYSNAIGNADSRTHSFGENARKVTEVGRKSVAKLLNVNADEVFFTSGATESNNIAIQGLREYAEKTGKKHMITTAIEHHAVLNTMKHMEKEGYKVDYILPESDGRINPDEVLNKVREDTLLVSIMHVNNETGMIQPIEKIGEELSKRQVLFHVDATQSCGKLVTELQKVKYDMLSMSAHKFHGPQGIGTLVLKKKKYRLPPVKQLFYGGQQEHGIRPGTTPVALVAGMGKACEIALVKYKENSIKMHAMKDSILDLLKNSGVEYIVHGAQEYCIPSTVNVQFVGVSSEALMIATKQFCGISNGSACTSKSYEPSYVLKAMGLSDQEAEESVRISWGTDTSEQELKVNLRELLNVVKSIQG